MTKTTTADDAEDPRRRVLLQMLCLGALGAVAPGLRAQSVFGSRPGKLPPDQSIYRVTGKVEVNGKPADLNTRIQPGDTIRSDRGAELVFVVGQQAMILRNESEVKLEAESGAKALLLSGLRLLTGKLLTVSRDQQLTVKTPTATIGIRGTGWYLEADPERTYFCTCYGTTEVAAAQDPSVRESIRSSHHDRPLYILDKPSQGQLILPAPFINHTDQELMLIETLVGRTPPFVFPNDAYSGPRRAY